MSNAGFPREARLRRPGDFTALRTSSGRAGGRCFHMRYRDNDLGHARLGLAISKRVSKRAVERNRIKRLLRESFRRVRHQLPAEPRQAPAFRAPQVDRHSGGMHRLR